MSRFKDRVVDPADKKGMIELVKDETKGKKICIGVTAGIGFLVSLILSAFCLVRYVSTQNIQKMWNPVNFVGYPIYDTACDIGVLEFAAQTTISLAQVEVPSLGPVGEELQTTGQAMRTSMAAIETYAAVIDSIDANSLIALLSGDTSALGGLEIPDIDLEDLLRDLPDPLGDLIRRRRQMQDISSLSPVDIDELLRVVKALKDVVVDEGIDLADMLVGIGGAIRSGDFPLIDNLDGKEVYTDNDLAIGYFADIIEDCGNDWTCYSRGTRWSGLFLGEGIVLLFTALMYLWVALSACVASCRAGAVQCMGTMCCVNFGMLIVAGVRRFSPQGNLCSIYNQATNAPSDSFEDLNDDTTYQTDGATILAAFVMQLLGVLCCCCCFSPVLVMRTASPK